MKGLINLAWIFAAWEFAKLLVGQPVLEEKAKAMPGGCLLLLFEVPYGAWGVWLLFTTAQLWAIVLWAITALTCAAYFRAWHYQTIWRINCAISGAMLAALAWSNR